MNNKSTPIIKQWWLRLLIAVAIVVVVAAGISLYFKFHHRNKFVGKWYFPNEGRLETYVFYNNGKCEAYINNNYGSCLYVYNDEEVTLYGTDANVKAKYEFVNGYLKLDEDWLYPSKAEAEKELTPIEVPNVSGMTVEKAKKELENAGFKVSDDIKYESSDKYAPGIVIKTEPSAGESVTKGKTIIIYESTGKHKCTIENYTGKNYIEVKTMLEICGLEVSIKTKSGYNNEIDEQSIIDQNIKAGTILYRGDKIVLYIPFVEIHCPDFVSEEWDLSEVKEFANKYNIKLSITYEVTSKYKSGTILKQSKKGVIKSGEILLITVAK